MTDVLFDETGTAAPAAERGVSSTETDRTGAAPSCPILLAVDGNSLCHRAFHAYERSNMTRKDGSPCFAIYGFMSLLAGICDKVRPDGIVVGFDDASRSVRKEAWPEYKANRSAKDPSLYVQMDEIQKILTELDVCVVVPGGLEADDVLGSAAEAAHASGWRCVIATSDRDAFALVDENTTVLRLVSGLDNAVWVTPDKLVEMYGIDGTQYRDFAALRGDTSDNLRGVTGVGEKTAAKLLAALGSVEAALADPDAATAAIGKAYAAKLTAGVDAWRHNREVMAIHRDIPIAAETCRLTAPEAGTAEVMRRWELPNLVTRMAVALAPTGGAADAHLPMAEDDAPEDADVAPGTAPETGDGGPLATPAEAGAGPGCDERSDAAGLVPAAEGPVAQAEAVVAAARPRPWLIPRPARFPLTLR